VKINVHQIPLIELNIFVLKISPQWKAQINHAPGKVHKQAQWM